MHSAVDESGTKLSSDLWLEAMDSSTLIVVGDQKAQL